MRLLMIRHAESSANVLGALSTRAPGPEITERGRRQAEALASRLSGEPIECVYHSALQRSRQTAEPLAWSRRLEPSLVEGIHEIEGGDYEGCVDPEEFERFLEPVRCWTRGDLAARVPGGSDGHEFFDRFDGAVRSVFDLHGDESTVAMVSHAGAMKVWLGARADNVDADFVAERSPANTGVVVLRGSPAWGWIVDSWEGSPLLP